MDYRERYNILRKIGSGGFSSVYLVTKKDNSKKLYALKVLELEKITHCNQKINFSFLISRFRQEVSILKKLNSKYCIKYYESSLDFNEERQLFVLIEYVKGKTLKNMIQTQLLTPTQAVEIIIKLCEGYSQIHKAGIIHKDIKPENILITKGNNPKIIDFGIAVINDNKLSKDSSIIGTTSYFSPEMITSLGKVSIKSDIYSLGLVLYYMLLETHPFKKENPNITDLEIANRILKQEISPIYLQNSKIPIPLSNCVQRSLLKNPILRYSSMKHFQKDLKTCFDLKRSKEKPLTNSKIIIKRLIEFITSLQFIIGIIMIFLVIIFGIVIGVNKW